MSAKKYKIWLSPPCQNGLEIDYLQQALKENWLAPVGPQLTAFEERLANETGVKACTLTSSGTAAIHLGLQALGVRAGDVVFCPSLTFVATANPILYLGAEPIFIDSEAQDYHLSPRWLEIALKHTPIPADRKPTLILVHLYGGMAQMTEIQDICQKYGVRILEDAAEALGATYNGQPAGSFGEMSVFSFNGNKIITTSGGGALLSNDKALVQKAKYWATQAKDPQKSHYQHDEMGYNYRMSNLLAAVGLAQIETLNQRIEARRLNNSVYKKFLEQLPGVKIMDCNPKTNSTHWLTTIQIDPEKSGGIDCERVRLALEKAGIESRPVWKPLHLQPIYSDKKFFGEGNCNRLFENGLCLPSGSDLTIKQLEEICSIVADLFH